MGSVCPMLLKTVKIIYWDNELKYFFSRNVHYGQPKDIAVCPRDHRSRVIHQTAMMTALLDFLNAFKQLPMNN